MRRYVTELIGTFFLVLTVCCVSLTGTPLGALAVGAVLMTMIFAGGHISGAHYNPAVTLAVFLRGRLDVKEVGPYMGAQLVGALAAAGLSRFIIDVEPVALTATGRAGST